MQKASMLYHKFKGVYLSGEEDLSPNYVNTLQQEREREESERTQREEKKKEERRGNGEGEDEKRGGREEKSVVERGD